MKHQIKALIIITLTISCQSNFEKSEQNTDNQKLTIEYNGEADVVQFKMFEGLHSILTKDSLSNSFTVVLEVPNLEEAIFTYDIITHRQDSTKKMIEFEPDSRSIKMNRKDAIIDDDQFIWVGEGRQAEYTKNVNISGELSTKYFSSEYLKEERELTVYIPKGMKTDTPHIFFTDGNAVEYYSPYVDELITSGEIKPIKLIGIHSSYSNRYEEYVKQDNENEIFKNHENFVFNEILVYDEEDDQKWNGKRYMYGFSNGAAFCMYSGLNYPNTFEEIIAFSTVDYISSMAQSMNPIRFDHNKYPKFYMGAGRYESRTFSDNIKFVKDMEDQKIQVEFKEFVAGHDYNTWRIEFLEYVVKRFGT